MKKDQLRVRRKGEQTEHMVHPKLLTAPEDDSLRYCGGRSQANSTERAFLAPNQSDGNGDSRRIPRISAYRPHDTLPQDPRTETSRMQ
jgi:hypothetical protein